MHQRILKLALGCAVVLACTGVTHAHTFDSSLLASFPSGVSEFAYLDLNQARSFSCYSQLQSQLVPVRVTNFERFLTTPSMGVGVEIDEAAWALASSEE